MKYPSRIDYNRAVQNISKTILEKRYEGGEPRRIGKELISYSGGYSQVYPIDFPDSSTAALRCWIRKIQHSQILYSQASQFLERKPSKYLVDFEYIPEGIKVVGEVYPVVYMEWVIGERLNKFLDKHVSDSELVSKVAQGFLEMSRSFHRSGISHGDLQDGNILIRLSGSTPTLKLIDYDSLFVPGLEENKRTLMGGSGYQHPSRKSGRISPEKVDHFSELVIYLSLLVYAERPKLWESGQEMQLLFAPEDIENPNESSIFDELETLSEQVKYLSSRLKGFRYEADLNRILPLEDIVAAIPKTRRLPQIGSTIQERTGSSKAGIEAQQPPPDADGIGSPEQLDRYSPAWPFFHALAASLGIGLGIRLIGLGLELQAAGSFTVVALWLWIKLTYKLSAGGMILSIIGAGLGMWLFGDIVLSDRIAASSIANGEPSIPRVYPLILATLPVTIFLWNEGYRRWNRLFIILYALAIGTIFWFYSTHLWTDWYPILEKWLLPKPALDQIGYILIISPLSVYLWRLAWKRWPGFCGSILTVVTGFVLWWVLNRTEVLWQKRWDEITDLPNSYLPTAVLIAPPLAWLLTQLKSIWPRAINLLLATCLSTAIVWLLDKSIVDIPFLLGLGLAFLPVLFHLWKQSYRRSNGLGFAFTLMLAIGIWTVVQLQKADLDVLLSDMLSSLGISSSVSSIPGSPTHSIEPDQQRTEKTPTDSPTPELAILDQAPEAAIPDCFFWKDITLTAEGREICIYGDVLISFKTEELGYDIYYLIFSEETSDFFVLSYDQDLTSHSPGECVLVSGTVESLLSSPIIVLGYHDAVDACPRD